MIQQYFLVATLVTISVSQLENGTLLAVRQVSRHGDRAPALFFSNESEYWPVGPGELLNKGKRRLYQLGQETRVRYSEFLPYYYEKKQFYVETTPVDRTHMSAQVNVAGMYPPRGHEVWEENLSWQPIPIHLTPEYILRDVPDCQTYFINFLVTITKARFLTNIVYNMTDVYTYLSEHSGFPVYSIVKVFLIEDALRQKKAMGFDLPEWAEAVYPYPLENLIDAFFLFLVATDNQKRIAIGGWFYQVITDFELIWANSSKPKYHIYSGHDTNIVAILTTLQAYKHRPGFGSTLYVELRNKSGEAVVNIWYRDEDTLEKIIPLNCSFDCPLATLKKKLEPWFIYNQDDWTSLCQKPILTEISNAALEIDRKFLQAVYNEIFEYASCENGEEPYNVKESKID